MERKTKMFQTTNQNMLTWWFTPAVDNPGCEWTKLIHSTWNWGCNHGGRNSIQKLGLGYPIQKR